MINGFISSRVFYISSFLITNVCCIFIIEQKCKTHIWFGPWVGKIPGEGTGYPLQYSWASLVDQLVKNPPAMWETWDWSLGLGRSPGEGKGYPLQYPGLENSIHPSRCEFSLHFRVLSPSLVSPEYRELVTPGAAFKWWPLSRVTQILCATQAPRISLLDWAPFP